MANIDIKVIVNAIDNASHVFQGLGKNIDSSLKKSAGGAGVLQKATVGLKGALSGVVGTAATAGLALGALGVVVAGVAMAIRPFIGAAIEMQNALMGLSTVANAFGFDADVATGAAKSLAADGLMSVNEAAAGLKNLLATGFSLPQAIDLMNTFKDSAAFNRQGMLGFGEAIVGATQGIKNQNSIMVDNAGITKNLSNIIKEQGGSLSDLSEVTSDAGVRQKLYNGLMKEGAIFSGDAEKASKTLGGQLSQLKTASFMLKAAIGDALSPAVEIVSSLFKDVLSSALGFVQKHMLGLQTTVLVLGTSFAIMASIVTGAIKILVGAVTSLFTLSFNPLKDAVKSAATDTFKVMYNAQNKMEDIAMKSAGVQTDAYEKSTKKIMDASGKKKSKLEKDLEDETETFEREMEKREASFKENLTDLIFAHIDKRDSLRDSLSEENDDFAEGMSERSTEFKDTMDEMRSDHEQKVADIQEQIEQEVAKGVWADESKIVSLQEELAKETEEYDKKKAKDDERYAAENAKLEEQHSKKIAGYQAEISKEEEILSKHQADVAAVKDQARVDDITRLKLQYEEEKKAATVEHEKKMKDLKEQGTAEGGAYGGGIVGGLTGPLAQVEKNMKDAGVTAGTNFAEGIVAGALAAGKGLVDNFFKGLWYSVTSAPKNIVGKWIERLGISGEEKQYLEKKYGTGGRAGQAGMVVPGEVGEPVPILAHGQERVIPAGLSGTATIGSGGVTFNVSVGLYAGTETEKRNIARDLYAALVQVAQSQNKSVKDLMGA